MSGEGLEADAGGEGVGGRGGLGGQRLAVQGLVAQRPGLLEIGYHFMIRRFGSHDLFY